MVQPFSHLMEVLYVGRSKNLRRRFARHLNTPTTKVRLARETYADSMRFWYLRIPNPATYTVESWLISCFGPPANDQPGETNRLKLGEVRAILNQ